MAYFSSLDDYLQSNSDAIGDYRSRYFETFGRPNDEDPHFFERMNSLPYIWAIGGANGLLPTAGPLAHHMAMSNSYANAELLSCQPIVIRKIKSATDTQLIGHFQDSKSATHIDLTQPTLLPKSSFAIVGFVTACAEAPSRLLLLDGWLTIDKPAWKAFVSVCPNPHDDVAWLMRYATALRRYAGHDLTAIAQRVQTIRPIEVN